MGADAAGQLQSTGRLAAALVALIRAYRRALSPWLGRRCRFLPTCSEYAEQAVLRHGAGRGAWLSLTRLLRCQPWCAHGYDPVPERFSWRGSRPAGPS
jgi:putative membrane protein insertion efficiency factor